MEIKGANSTIGFIRQFGSYSSRISGFRVEIDATINENLYPVIHFIGETFYEDLINKRFNSLKLDMYGNDAGIFSVLSYKFPDTTWK